MHEKLSLIICLSISPQKTISNKLILISFLILLKFETSIATFNVPTNKKNNNNKKKKAVRESYFFLSKPYNNE